MSTQDDLATVLSQFARTLVTDYPIQKILDHLVKRIVDILPITATGVTLISASTSPRLIAGSNESAFRYTQVQTELEIGPSLAAYEMQEPIAIQTLPRTIGSRGSPRARSRRGYRGVFTFPVRNEDRAFGALDLYRTSTGPLGEEDLESAQTLADAASAYLINAQARTARAEFVATVSHELRTPMTNIGGASSCSRIAWAARGGRSRRRSSTRSATATASPHLPTSS